MYDSIGIMPVVSSSASNQHDLRNSVRRMTASSRISRVTRIDNGWGFQRGALGCTDDMACRSGTQPLQVQDGGGLSGGREAHVEQAGEQGG